MVLDALSSEERRGVYGAFIGAIAVSVILGFAGGTVYDTGSSAASESEISSIAESVVSQNIATQQQQLQSVANQTGNLSAEDVSLSVEDVTVERSDIGSLYEATVQISGSVPNQQGQLETVDEEQVFYISGDGRYIFQNPIDLEESSQQSGVQGQPQQAPQQPTTQGN